MSSDDEMERIKARRLAEMQKNLSMRRAESPGKKPSPRDVVVAKLGYRGLEVLQEAEKQFPAQTRVVTAKLADLILQGEVAQAIDGGELLALFRAVGLRVRVKTTISVEQDGKMISLSEKMNARRGG